MKKIELLSPAGNADIAIEAIKHGADAIYIGAPSHGARKNASNSPEEIRRVVDFAHIFGAKVYVTVNTIIYENELRDVERMIREIYRAGADALIVQDMGILRMDIPPIALHASTQCDIRTPEKARFLQEVGFSQIVLARELTIKEIKAITAAVEIPVEVFVHGALCVSYSGRCSAGFACAGRSGNRGECPQICRLPFTLRDGSGKILAKDKYLLSLKDYRAENHLEELIEAGVSSFKIEGRLKEAGYVKNVTAYYSRRLNEITEASQGKYIRSSYGNVELKFEPSLEKSFNRGFTDYGLGRSMKNIASIHTPKSLGEPIKNTRELRPGDGISFFDKDGRFDGVLVNGIRNGDIIGNRPFSLPAGARIYRTSSVEWKKLMAAETAVRTLPLNITLSISRREDATFSRRDMACRVASAETPSRRDTACRVAPPSLTLKAQDPTGSYIILNTSLKGEPARKENSYISIFEKLGDTPFRLNNFESHIAGLFFPASALTSARRELIKKLLQAKRATYRYDYRRNENRAYPYPAKELDYRDNVANSLAETFYKEHGIRSIEPALEVSGRSKAKGKKVMTTRHCILRELGLCLKQGSKPKLPLTLESGNIKLTPSFDCTRCEMHLNHAD